ncbi:TonB-dependent receptor [Flaviaesturariibacter flavus]|uniref:TonB-dependent receptor n=1 Tax=Flaviaesturariibacter flavus TaxID=2502780 RepID=A0A4R1B6E7_9BACT|nr:outer membrane beta-barrel family protein [Flaviaesturariibacter flavus]TCJ13250.1 TonB-dependent receptor [Flaviaesturariibacter flavus]
MKKTSNLRRLLLLLCAQLTVVLAFAQGSINGTVKDSTSAKGLQYATIELFAAADPAKAVKSGYTNDKGRFNITGLDSGRYLVIISHTGFGERQQTVNVGRNEAVAIGEVSLGAVPKEMQGVVVKMRKPLIESSDDKISYNVANDPVAKTETAIDILRRTPYVSVDGDGNVTVNGQSNFKVLLNGRETAMFAQNVKEALKGFPGALITRIEVITSPSAKYDAEGVGGIINIITAKKVVGYNGSVNTYYTSTGWWNANANISAKYGKLGFTLYYGSGGGVNIPGINRTTTTSFDPNARYAKRELFGKRYSNNFWNFGNAEINYELDSLNTVSVYGNISGGKGRRSLDQTITTSYADGRPDSMSLYMENARNEYPTKSVGADYVRKFANNKEREFSLRFNGEFGTSNSFNDAVTDNPVASDRYVVNNSEAMNRQYTLQADYVHPMKKDMKIEGGVKTILRRASSDFESLDRTSAVESYKTNPANTDFFNYNQEVYSAYASYSFKVKKVSFRVGGRFEHTDVDGNFTSGATRVQQAYNNFLPNVQISTKVGQTNLVFNFSQRIQRPFIWNLNPFRINNDSFNVTFGNPGLQPQLIHSASIAARVSKGSTFFGLTLNGTYSDNMIVQYATFDPATGVTSTTSGNLGKETGLNLSGNVNAKLSEKWNVSVNGNVRWSQVESRADARQKASGFGGNANLNSNFNWSKKIYSYAYAGYFKNAVTFQTNYALNLWYGIGTGVKLWNDKFNVSLGISNFFEKDRDYRNVTTAPNFQTVSVSTLPNRGFSLGLTWNFGKMTENVSKKKGVTNDDLVGGSGGGR